MLNLSEVFERVGDSLRRTQLVLEGFFESYQELIERLLTAKESQDPKTMSRAAHALKGLLLDIGAKTTSQLAARIETTAASGNYSEAAEMITPLGQQTLVIARLVELALERMGLDAQAAASNESVPAIELVQ